MVREATPNSSHLKGRPVSIVAYLSGCGKHKLPLASNLAAAVSLKIWLITVNTWHSWKAGILLYILLLLIN